MMGRRSIRIVRGGVLLLLVAGSALADDVRPVQVMVNWRVGLIRVVVITAVRA